MNVPVYKVALLVGYQKAHVSGSRGQLVSMAIGTPHYPGQWADIRIGEGSGMYLHGRTKKAMCWWVAEQWLATGDLVKLETKVAEAGVGIDEQRSMTIVWTVDPGAALVEVRWPGIGFKDWPLLKGRVREVSRTSPQIERDLSITEIYEEGYDTSETGTGAVEAVGQEEQDK